MAVLGVMAELGERHAAEHVGVADLAAALGIELLAVNETAYGTPTLADTAEALAALGPLRRGDAVLVKGSRVAGLERLALALVKESEDAAPA